MFERDKSTPISVVFAEPWIKDNQLFINNELAARDRTLLSLRDRLRPRLLADGLICIANPSDCDSLGAVDASVVDVTFDELHLVLVQAAYYCDGHTYLDIPQRHGPVDEEVRRYLNVPARSAREILLLADVTSPTIADNSFWSLLMEFNLAITSLRKYRIDIIEPMIDDLCNGTFLRMLENTFVIAMPKIGVTDSLSKTNEYKQYFESKISDREAYTCVLDEGEYIKPRFLSLLGEFGVETDRISEKSRDRIRYIYKKELFYTYFRPWRYKKAYRIEGRESMLCDRTFASVKAATCYREIAEPLPQFYVDRVVKQLHGISQLYGEANRFRTSIPFIGFNRT